ncbi:MAG: aconitase family protein, partial [Cyclobacteriaceae bacterium]|nr:aconitase family protein [Cyclobacteriaceae bacterium]
TFNYIRGRKFAPQNEVFDRKVEEWKKLKTDEGASYDSILKFDAADIAPMITYGTNPGMGMKVTDRIPTVAELKEISEQHSFTKSLEYMGLEPGSSLLGKAIDYVFIGSCTNARIEDLRLVADMVKGKTKATNVEVWVVPGSKQVEEQARREGLDKIFEAAGFELRSPGCSACLGMNEDKVPAGKYCISTSNRNFEGRQGPKSRTFLASPLSAAAAAITGRVTDVREFV